jgi:signal peptidase
MRNVVVVLALLLAAALLLPAAFGLRGFAITGGSMGDALPAGSLAFDRSVPAGELDRGDVVTFVPAGRGTAVTHRVVGRDARGVITRGDANAGADPWRVSGTVQRVAFHVTLAGRAVAATRGLALGGALLGLAFVLLRAAARPGRRRATA